MLSKNEIKLIKSLESKKFRRKHRLFIIEGERLVNEAYINDAALDQVFISDSYSSNNNKFLIDVISHKSIPTKIIPDNQMKDISDTVTPSGILALCKIPEQPKISSTFKNNILYLDSIQDPGNLGTLLRSASWFGLKHVVLSENCIDAYNPKVVRGGMGAHFNLDVFCDTALNIFVKHTKIGGFQDGVSIESFDTKTIEPWILVIGNESNGISSDIAELIERKITIRKLGGGESLNAAVAGSILLFHLTAKS